MLPILFSLIPMSFSLLGGIFGFFWKIKGKELDALYSFVSGVLLAAIASELVPKFLNSTRPLSLALSFILGAAFMFGLHALSHALAHSKKNDRLPLGIIGGTVVDLFVDGILISLTFLAGFESGLILAFSLAPCAFLLTLTISKAFKKIEKKGFFLLLIAFIALMLPLGATLGWFFTQKISSSLIKEILAFATAALLYIAVDELLLEHRTESRSHLSSVTFFVGFLGALWFQL